MAVNFDAAEPVIAPRRGRTPVLADQIFRRGRIMDVVLVVSGALLISICAQVVVGLWPVPSTGQIVGVMVVAFALGLVRGTLATLLYLFLGIAGLPVFNNGGLGWEHFTGVTGGYLVGFAAAAIVAGFLAERGWDRRLGTALAATSLSTMAIYCVGVPWIAVHNNYSLLEALEDGLYPLLFGAVLKIIFVAALSSAQWKAIERYDQMAREREAARRAAKPSSF